MIDKVIAELEENRQKRLNGDLIAIPWISLPRLNAVLPGVQQGKYFLIGARPKSGKTQITDYLFMYEVFDWWYEHRDHTDIIPMIDYWSLEMSSKLKWISAISYKLFKSYGIIASPQKLQSVFENYILGEDIIKIIKSSEFQAWLKAFESVVAFRDNLRNPTGIFKSMKDWNEANGYWTEKIIPWRNEDKTISERRVKDRFVHNNPNLYHISITDHISLLSAERGQTLFDAIQKHSGEYCIELRDSYNMIPVDVQQMSAASATAEYTSGGKIILDKLRPSDSDLSDNKHTSMNINVMLSLFWPYKYKIPEYEGWDMSRMGNSHRELNLNLNRDGISNASIQLSFLGACNYFAELPRDPSERVYQQIEKYNKETI